MFFINRKYTDFDGNEREEKVYFNLTESEILELMYSEAGGIDKYIDRIIQERDQQKIIGIVKELMRCAYGEKSPDGREFHKSDEIWGKFESTQLFSDIYMDLATDANKLVDFFNRLIPNSLRERVEKYVKEHPEDENVEKYKQLTE